MRPTARENAALVRRFLADVIAGGDTSAADAIVADGVTDRNAVFQGGRLPARDHAVGLGWRVLAGADVDIAVDEVVASRERVAVRATVTGTHRESLLDLAPTGDQFEIAHAWFCRIDDGLIAEIWSLPDGLGLVRQLGAGPDPEANDSPNDRREH
jgi:predicted ester cyclase